MKLLILNYYIKNGKFFKYFLLLHIFYNTYSIYFFIIFYQFD